MKNPIPPPYTINRDRWNQLTILEQLRYIGSEVGRTLKLKHRGTDFEPALIRALDLFDATIELLVSKKSYRLKEVLRARDQFLQSIFVKEDNAIEQYFMQFAIAARNTR